eukprot:gene11965-13948_t
MEVCATFDHQPTLSHHIDKGAKYRLYAIASDATGDRVAIGTERTLLVGTFNEDDSQVSMRKVSASKDTCSGVLSWCHESTKSSYLASSSANNLSIWDMNEEKCTHSYQKAHIRHITSLSWNNMDSNLLASASGDSIVKIWDLRDPKNASYSINTKTILSQVSWNPHSSTMFATSHAVSCGSDKSIKIWDVPNKLIRSYQTGSPCSEAKFVPFSNHQAIASFSQKGYNELSFWSGSNSSSVMTLSGHQGSIISFDWRIKTVNGQKKYYAVSIGKDSFFKMWEITPSMIESIENVPTPESIKSNNQRVSSKDAPIDLSQELVRIQRQEFKNLTVEKTSISDRICMVNVDNRKVIIIISFPSLYPSAPPSFEIVTKDQSSSINNIKVKFKKELDSLALELLETKKPFLYQLLKRFSDYHLGEIESLKDINSIVESPMIQRRASRTLPPIQSSPIKSPRKASQSDSESDSMLLLSPTMDMPRYRSSSATPPLNSQDVPPTKTSRTGSIGAHTLLPPNYSGNQSLLFVKYTVKPTDTLTGIALQFGMHRDTLIHTNRLFSEKVIPGTELWVTKKRINSVPTEQVSLLLDSGDSDSPMTNHSLSPLASSVVPAARPRSKSGSSSININDLFKPVKEEVEFAFQTLDPSKSPLTAPVKTQPIDTAMDKYSWGGHKRFAQIPKENVVKEELVCFMKDKKTGGTLTLTPYQLIFQSHIHKGSPSSSTQIYADYTQIISCKYFPNHAEWIAHLSKDWNREQYLIKKKNNEKNNEYDRFIQGEISKLNEMEEEITTIKISGKDKKVMVFPCIYALIHKDKQIQTLFFRGVDEESVLKCFSYLKKMIVDTKESSPLNVGTPGSYEDYCNSPKLLKDNYHQQEQIILTPEIFKKLRHYLPMTVQGSNIELHYNTTSDGVSFNTFFRKLKNIPQSILLIKDNGGHIFGAYLSEDVKQKDCFYGTGESFLFKIYPEFHVYKWTKENDFFIFTCMDYLVVGGGSMFGLWMDTDFNHGFSSNSSDFRPVVVEAWGIK